MQGPPLLGEMVGAGKGPGPVPELPLPVEGQGQPPGGSGVLVDQEIDSRSAEPWPPQAASKGGIATFSAGAPEGYASHPFRINGYDVQIFAQSQIRPL